MILPAPSGALPAHENPFRAGRLESLPYLFPEGWSWERLEARLERLGGRGVVAGPHGSGKTTLLLELGRRLEERGFGVLHLRFDTRQRRPTAEDLERVAGVGGGDALLIDGGEQLDRSSWRRLRRAARAAGILVLASHRWGRLPPLFATATSPRLLARVVGRLDPGGLPALAPYLPQLHGRHRGDLRAALFSLYDRAAGRHPRP